MLAQFLASTLAFAADEVTSLPGWSGPLPSRQFSGYLDVGASKHLHYSLVESEGSPSTDPTVLWLNGGPGCSSLDGFIYEHGPFRTAPTDPTKLVRFAPKELIVCARDMSDEAASIEPKLPSGGGGGCDACD